LKNISAGLLARLQRGASSLTEGIKITPAFGGNLAFTKHKQDVTVGGTTYLGRPGMTLARTQALIAMQPSNSEAAGFFASGIVTAADVYNQRFDDARFEKVIFDPDSLGAGAYTFQKGFIGNIKMVDQGFVVELRSLMQVLDQKVGKVVSRLCSVREFGDAECGFPRNVSGVTDTSGVPYRVTGTVAALYSDPYKVRLTLSTSGFGDWLYRGDLIWTSGNNNGRQIEIIDCVFSSGTTADVVLLDSPGYPMVVGDTCIALRGCDRSIEACRNNNTNHASYTYLLNGNARNFRGFPDLAGDAIYYYADQGPTYQGGSSGSGSEGPGGGGQDPGDRQGETYP
jgi:uncharacterized phage protein (TIGR02218 family)